MGMPDTARRYTVDEVLAFPSDGNRYEVVHGELLVTPAPRNRHQLVVGRIHARLFNYWEPTWPEDLRNQLNPDVTVRTRGVMEKCTFCIQRIRRATRGGEPVEDGALQPACAQACPTSALVFGNANDADAKVSRLKNDERHFRVMEHLGTDPSVTYLKQVDVDG